MNLGKRLHRLDIKRRYFYLFLLQERPDLGWMRTMLNWNWREDPQTMTSYNNNRPCYLTWLTGFHQQNPILGEKNQRIHLNNTKMEHILLPWAVLGMIILIIRSMSFGVSCPCPDCGGPPTAQEPVSAPGPSALSQWLQHACSPIPLSPGARSRSCPSLGPSHPPDAQRWDCPSAPTLLGWQDRSWLSCPMRCPLILHGPGRFRRVMLGIFSLERHPMPTKMFLCLLFD